ncbi:type II toxin-antitoxin system VapC family toxin [Halomicrobium sp. LC1Hm]|uniref:type II toxin-antitoxin system VapC family toxin n=1 Tax=Halomicrobium sp. LC1Hm TaxID=2610902 RepID=UPI0012983172|nr:type II toxin-antitoxin system VapC family toxin [Halomicrobium sp. LC1Hm]QGA82045.1 PIN domain containing protein [Halomicrobium sp. LC1Hm]
MIVLDRDILAKLTELDQQIVQHLGQYREEEWTIPAIVAWESYKAQPSRSQMIETQNNLQSNFDRIINFTDDTALEAAYLGEKLQSQGVSLDAADLLNLATAHEEGATFVTHNSNDFDKGPVTQLTDVDVVHTE